MKLRTLAPLSAIALLALAGCSNSENTSDSAPDTPTASNTAESQVDAAPSPTQDVGDSFTLADDFAFITSGGATGTLQFNPAEPPADIQNALALAGRDGGTWAAVSIDNREGFEDVYDLTVAAFDSAGTKYTFVEDRDITSGLYGNSSSDDPNQDTYWDVYDAHNSAPGEIEPGEVRDFFLYSEDPWPDELEHGYVSGAGMDRINLTHEPATPAPTYADGGGTPADTSSSGDPREILEQNIQNSQGSKVELRAWSNGPATVGWDSMNGEVGPDESFDGEWSKEITSADGDIYSLDVSTEDSTAEVSCELLVDGELVDEDQGNMAWCIQLKG